MEHLTKKWSGIHTKVAYSHSEAETAARDLTQRKPWRYTVYVCGQCAAWHVGRNKVRPPAVHRDDAAVLELGLRVLVAQFRENDRTPNGRLGAIRGRVHRGRALAAGYATDTYRPKRRPELERWERAMRSDGWYEWPRVREQY